MNSFEFQPSSGYQSRPAGLAMSGVSIITPFKFRTRRESVDWRQINAIDVERVASELDFQLLQEHIAGVTFCNLEGERCLNCQSHVDPALLKLFRLAQLTIEYLLHSQDCLALRLQAAEEQLQTEAKEKQHLQLHLQKQIQDTKSLKDELKQRKRIVVSQQAMISAGLANYYKCQYCEKAFMNTSFLKSHMQRRHPMEHDKLITDNQKDLQTLKLQEEISKLQEQLTLAKSEMEILQKDYNTKKELDLTQKQADFMKQLEFWKENEYVRMNRKIDEVKQACQRDMDSMHQKNRNLENQMLMLQQSSKMQENRKPVQGQTSSVQNSEDEQNQEVRWTTEMQKIKEEYESEKNQLQTALAQVNSTVSKEKKRVERKVKELELRLEEQQQIITSQNMQIKKYTANSPKSTIQQEEFAAVAAIAEPKRRMVISESSSLSEGPADSQSMQQKVNELLKNTSLKRDMNLAVQQNLHDKLLHLGIKPAVGGISRTTYESAMAHVLSERQQRQRIYSKYRKMHKDLSQKLDRRVKDRSTRSVVKPKQSGQVQTLPQSRPRSSSLPTRQQYTPQPAHQNNTATHSTTSTQMAHHKTRQFGLVEDSSGEEEFDKNFPHAQKATMKCHYPGVQQHTATPALASFQKAAQSSESHQTPVFSISKMKVTMSENESEWTEGSEMDEISIDQLQKHTDQNGNVTKTLCSYVKALSNSLQQQLADQSHATKTARVGIPDKLAGITNTNDAVWEIKNTGFEDDNDDDWDISSLEDVPAEHSSVRKSMDKSIDTSTSLWGTFTEPRQGPGLKDTGTGSTLKSSIVTVSDWDDSDGAKI